MIRQIFILFFLLPVLFSPASGAGAEKTLTIGVSGVYSGGFASVGKSVSDGISDYLRWISEQGGIAWKDPESGALEKVQLRVLIEDNRYNPAEAIRVYNLFRSEGADAIIGFGSTPGQVCAASASEDRLPYLSWYAYATPMGYKPKPQYYWTLLPTAPESATPMIKWFVKEKWQKPDRPPKVAIMAADVPSWRIMGKPGLLDVYIRSLGGVSVGIEFIPLVTPDLTAVIAKLLFEKEADALILVGTSSQTVVLAKDLARMGIDREKTTVICSISSWDESLFKSIPKAIDGLYGEVHTISPKADTAGMKKVREIAQWAGRRPDEVVINYITGRIGAMVLERAVINALEKHGYEKVAASGEYLRDEIHTLSPFDPLGLSAPVGVLYPDQPFFYNNARMVRAEKGKFTEQSGWISVDRIPGSME